MLNEIICGDNKELLKTFEDNSFDAIVTDPPYDLTTTRRWGSKDAYSKNQSDVGKRFSKGFMGMKWDGTGIAFDLGFWEECLRVLKPGGHLLAFGGTRTYHRMVCVIEDAGFEIRDTIQWIYASGFPKSLDISKAIDKKFGAEREVVGRYQPPNGTEWYLRQAKNPEVDHAKPTFTSSGTRTLDVTAPTTDEAKQWQGWGTALKPANEPIVVARKPIEEKTIAENVLRYGTGGINIDGCRIGRNENDRTEYGINRDEGSPSENANCFYERERVEYNPHTRGRFPANVIFECICSPHPDYVYKNREYEVEGFIKSIKPNSPSNYNDKKLRTVHTDPDCPCYILDQQTKNLQASKGSYKRKNGNNQFFGLMNNENVDPPNNIVDGRGASRFFYCAKASRSEREYGLKEFKKKLFGQSGGALTKLKNGETEYLQEEHIGLNKIKSVKNNHPTIKPVELMRYLVRLVTPPNGKILDPFAGSGTTGIAAKLEGFDFVGIEKEEDYCLIARARIKAWQPEEVQENLFCQMNGRQVNEVV